MTRATGAFFSEQASAFYTEDLTRNRDYGQARAATPTLQKGQPMVKNLTWIVIGLCLLAIALLQAAMPACDGLADVEMIYCQESGMYLAGIQLALALLIIGIVSYRAVRNYFPAK